MSKIVKLKCSDHPFMTHLRGLIIKLILHNYELIGKKTKVVYTSSVLATSVFHHFKHYKP